ncbi:MAG TPA: hypothetical protein VGN72_14270 [Tepidisphaeraceae bacterium]|nr:hypothetical protein [Tepidisphaeraceae bacterium]
MNRVAKVPLRARLKTWRQRPRFPVWTTGRAMLVAGMTSGVCSMLFLVLNASPFVETEIFLAAVSVCLMVFLTVGLYTGARVKRETEASAKFDPGRWMPDESPSNFDMATDFPAALEVDEGCIGGIVALVIWIVVSVLLVALLTLLVSLFLPVFAVVLTAVFWMFYRALRLVLLRGRKCRGNLLKSAGYAAFYTFLYTGWLLAVVQVAGMLAERRITG